MDERVIHVLQVEAVLPNFLLAHVYGQRSLTYNARLITKLYGIARSVDRAFV